MMDVALQQIAISYDGGDAAIRCKKIRVKLFSSVKPKAKRQPAILYDASNQYIIVNTYSIV